MPDFLCGRFELSLRRPLVMGIVNVTPDSFSDGGRYAAADAALAHARALLDAGADILDIGGESTRPGAPAVPDAEEAGRVLPVIEALRGLDVPLSVDTRKPAVMQAALDAGADMLNDIAGFASPEAAAVASGHRTCGLVAMHMQGEPGTMQAAPHYDDVVAEVFGALAQRAQALVACGVQARRIMLDPGFGFGKTVEHNYRLLAALPRLCEAGFPVLAGLSRKSMIGAVTGKPVADRAAGSIGGALAAVARGAAVVRVHDVAETVDALAVWHMVNSFDSQR